MSPFKFIFLVATLGLALASCGGSQVSLDYRPLPKPLFNESDARDMLDQAKSEKELIEAIGKIEKQAHSSFNWGGFWKLLDEKKITLLGQAEKEALFSLHAISCKEKSFYGFVDLLIRLDADLDFLLSPKNQCEIALDEGQLVLVVRAAVKKANNDASPEAARQKTAELVVRLLNQEAKRNPDSTLFTDEVLGNNPTLAEWEGVLALLKSRADLFPLAIDFTVLTDAYPKFKAFPNRLVAPVIQDHAQFKEVLKKVGLQKLARLLSLGTDRFFLTQNKKNLENVLSWLDAEYAPDLNVTSDTIEREWLTSWSTLHSMRLFQSKVRVYPEQPALVLAWAEKQQRKVEKLFLKDPFEALRFLEINGYQSLDAEWMSYRLKAKQGLPVALYGEEHYAGYQDPVSQALRLRLASYQDSSALGRQLALKKYCDFLTDHKVASAQEISVAEVQARPELIAAPGCHRVRVEPGVTEIPNARDPSEFVATLNIHRDEWVQSYDSVVIAPGVSLDVQAKIYDGALFDLSADQTFEKRPVEPTPEPYDAIVFPIVMGLGMEKESKPVVSFGVFHFVYRYPRPAIDWVNDFQSRVKLRDGLAGGSIQIKNLGTEEESIYSTPPAMTSLGGVGQEWQTLTVLGGKGQPSEFDFDDIYTNSMWLDRVKFQMPKELEGKKIEFLDVPLFFHIKEWMDLAKKHSPVNIYVDAQFHLGTTKFIRSRILHAQDVFLQSQGLPPATPSQQVMLTEEFLKDAEEKAFYWLDDKIAKHHPYKTIEEPAYVDLYYHVIQDLPSAELTARSSIGPIGVLKYEK